MKKIGVVIGTIVDANKIQKAGQRDRLFEVIDQTVKDLSAYVLMSEIKIDIYRGDSFQIVIANPVDAMIFSILFRSNLIAKSGEKIRWDVRMGIGVGTADFLKDSVIDSDGEAFYLAGMALEILSRNGRMAVLTPDDEFNHELAVSTAFADDIVSNWTVAQAELFYQMHLEDITQKDLAEMQDKTPQAISKVYIASRMSLIEEYIKRFSDKTSKVVKQRIVRQIKK